MVSWPDRPPEAKAYLAFNSVRTPPRRRLGVRGGTEQTLDPQTAEQGVGLGQVALGLLGPPRGLVQPGERLVGAAGLEGHLQGDEGGERLLEGAGGFRRRAAGEQTLPQGPLGEPEAVVEADGLEDAAGLLGQLSGLLRPSGRQVGLGQKSREPAQELLHPRLAHPPHGLLQRLDSPRQVAPLQIGIAQEAQGRGGVERVLGPLEAARHSSIPRSQSPSEA